MKLEEAIERCNELIREKHANWIGLTSQEAISTVLQEIEHLQKENEKLTEARDWYFECTVRQIATPEMLDKILKDKYINKNKIIEKIKEIYEDENSEYYDMFLEQRDIEKTIGILKDLLKEE